MCRFTVSESRPVLPWPTSLRPAGTKESASDITLTSLRLPTPSRSRSLLYASWVSLIAARRFHRRIAPDEPGMPHRSHHRGRARPCPTPPAAHPGPGPAPHGHHRDSDRPPPYAAGDLPGPALPEVVTTLPPPRNRRAQSSSYRSAPARRGRDRPTQRRPSGLKSRSGVGRRGPESNRRWSFCRALPYHLATAPWGGMRTTGRGPEQDDGRTPNANQPPVGANHVKGAARIAMLPLGLLGHSPSRSAVRPLQPAQRIVVVAQAELLLATGIGGRRRRAAAGGG